MRLIVKLAVFFLYIHSIVGYTRPINHLHTISRLSSTVLRTVGSREQGVLINDMWYNSSYSKDMIDRWWLEIDRPLLTIGVGGVKSTQINSLITLVTAHERVRVRLSSDRINVDAIIDNILKDPAAKDSIMPLQIRKREIMFSKCLKPSK
jgi:hypothetical protein